jgi:NAD(P)-dependent dehydrogenase (short-subunit alcohol dehydrogenase family)
MTERFTGVSGHAAIVTGAGSGLGRSHARALAALGAHVVVNDMAAAADPAQVAPADQVVAEIRAAGGTAIADRHDVSTAAGGRAIVDAALQEFGSVEIVVNNAGVLRDAAFADMTPEIWAKVIDVHLNGAFFVTQPAWQIMQGRGYGRIVFTTSASGVFGNTGHANYGAAKMALVGLCRMLALEGSEHGITANAIAPMASTAMSVRPGSRARAADIMGELFETLRPEPVSSFVVWLCGEGCSVSGETFSVSGGRAARIFVAETMGHVGSLSEPHGVATNLDQIRSLDSFCVPESMAEELALLRRELTDQPVASGPEVRFSRRAT